MSDFSPQISGSAPSANKARNLGFTFVDEKNKANSLKAQAQEKPRLEGKSIEKTRSQGIKEQVKPQLVIQTPLPTQSLATDSNNNSSGNNESDDVKLSHLQDKVADQTMLLNQILKNNVFIEKNISLLSNALKSICPSQPSSQSVEPRPIRIESQKSSKQFNMGLFLSGQLRSTFKYQLLLQNYLELPLYKQKNFSLSIKLVDHLGNTFSNEARIPLCISVYSTDNPPKQIDYNVLGNRIVKGFCEQDLAKGQCQFEKIQVKEVTSRFRKGWIYLVVSPKMGNSFFAASGSQIQWQDIKPLVIDKVVVKSKKTLKKGQQLQID